MISIMREIDLMTPSPKIRKVAEIEFFDYAKYIQTAKEKANYQEKTDRRRFT